MKIVIATLVLMASAARADFTPSLDDVVRHFERAVAPADRGLRSGEFFGAERFAVRFCGSGFFWCAVADGGFAGDQHGLVGLGRRFEGARYGEFRVDRDTGEAVLTGLRDENFQAL